MSALFARMRKGSYLVVLISLLSGFAASDHSSEKGGSASAHSPNRPLEIVFCIDLSGSTNGLVNDVRDQLWLMVNMLQRLDPAPDLRIGVIGFSRPSFGKENSYVKVLTPLTRNFDFIAAELYKLKPSIEKGDQIVSAALRTAVMEMDWSVSPQAEKMIFLVGNGMVTANGYEYVRFCEEARSRNIPIHALYVTKAKNYIQEIPGYRRIAGITNGVQTEVTVNKKDTLRIWPSPTSYQLSVNQRMNSTYVWYGSDSSTCRKVFSAADSGALHTSDQVLMHRLYYKSGSHFRDAYYGCDRITTTALTPAEGEDEQSGMANQKLREIFTMREEKRAKLAESFDDAGLNELQKLLLAGNLTEESVFYRCVLSIVYRSWGQN